MGFLHIGLSCGSKRKLRPTIADNRQSSHEHDCRQHADHDDGPDASMSVKHSCRPFLPIGTLPDITHKRQIACVTSGLVAPLCKTVRSPLVTKFAFFHIFVWLTGKRLELIYKNNVLRQGGPLALSKRGTCPIGAVVLSILATSHVRISLEGCRGFEHGKIRQPVAIQPDGGCWNARGGNSA